MKLSLKNLKLSSFTKYGLAAVAVVFVLWLGLTLLSSGPTKSAAVRVDKSRCPDCGLPLSKSAQMDGECPYCAMKNGGRAKKKATSPLSSGPLVPTVLISLFLVMLGVHLFALYRNRPAAVEEVLYHTNCRKCDRKVRYRNHQAGKLARCPNCRNLMRFPEEIALPKGRWAKMKDWLTISTKKKAHQQDPA